MSFGNTAELKRQIEKMQAQVAAREAVNGLESVDTPAPSLPIKSLIDLSEFSAFYLIVQPTTPGGLGGYEIVNNTAFKKYDAIALMSQVENLNKCNDISAQNSDIPISQLTITTYQPVAPVPGLTFVPGFMPRQNKLDETQNTARAIFANFADGTDSGWLHYPSAQHEKEKSWWSPAYEIYFAAMVTKALANSPRYHELIYTARMEKNGCHHR